VPVPVVLALVVLVLVLVVLALVVLVLAPHKPPVEAALPILRLHSKLPVFVSFFPPKYILFA